MPKLWSQLHKLSRLSSLFKFQENCGDGFFMISECLESQKKWFSTKMA